MDKTLMLQGWCSQLMWDVLLSLRASITILCGNLYSRIIWKIENTFENINERTKEGDDYPARLYVVFSGGLFFWQTKALNYVWSSNEEVGVSWPNAYSSNAVMIAVQSGVEKVGKWVKQKRNIREDFRRYFGRDVKEVHAVAIMTDTDDTNGNMLAYYGNIYFTSE